MWGLASGDIEEKLRGFSCGASHGRIFSSSSDHFSGEEKLDFVGYLDKAKQRFLEYKFDVWGESFWSDVC